MSITDFYTTTFTVLRQVWTTDDDSNAFSEATEVGSFSGHIQQLNPQLAEGLAMAFTKSFRIWCDEETDVKEGDELTAGGYSYSVRAIKKFLPGANKHLEVYVEQQILVST